MPSKTMKNVAEVMGIFLLFVLLLTVIVVCSWYQDKEAFVYKQALCKDSVVVEKYNNSSAFTVNEADYTDEATVYYIQTKGILEDGRHIVGVLRVSKLVYETVDTGDIVSLNIRDATVLDPLYIETI